jgi:hypothetical protein
MKQLDIKKKVDYKREFKDFYLPKTEPMIITLPSFPFAVIAGQGDPNGQGFAEDTAALYAFSYAVKMSYKSTNIPDGYYEYTVFPLEGEWDLVDKSKPSTDKNNYRYRIMIRQPDFVNAQAFQKFLAAAKKKKPIPALSKLTFEELEEGQCCQMLHLGSYDDEPASFARMEEFCQQAGYRRLFKSHREIYLSDPRKTEASKLKTVLRFKIACAG